jgi:2-phosphoglycerate kinase
MIYLIGGPSRSGKSIIAKKLSHKIEAEIIPMDYIEAATMEYYPKERSEQMCPFSTMRKKTDRDNNRFVQEYSAQEIVDAFEAQGQSAWPAIRAIVKYGLKRGDDLIIDGYQITPSFMKFLNETINSDDVRAVFVYQKDVKSILKSFKEHTVSDDWILREGTSDDTLLKFAELTSLYGIKIEKESQSNNFKSFCMDEKFESQLEKVLQCLMR